MAIGTYRRIDLDHRGGTKSYSLILAGINGRQILINRWGKTGYDGQMQVAINADQRDLERALNERDKKGYNVTKDREHNFTDVESLKKLMGVFIWSKMGGDNLKYLFPDADATGIKGPEDADEWVKGPDGRMQRVPKASRLLPEVEPTIEEQVAKDATWGMF